MGWLRRVERVLGLASRQTIILVRSSSSAGLRVLFETLERCARELRALVEPQGLQDGPVGETILLEVRPEHAAWLNAHRPIIVSRRLELVLWCSTADARAIASEAPDFWDWISHMVDAPGGPPRFTRRGMEHAGARIAWTGSGLPAMWAAREQPEPPCTTLGADASYQALLEAAADAERWLLIEGLTRPEQLVRIRWALAQARRTEPTVLVRPSFEPPGWCIVHDRAMDWCEASRELRESWGADAEALALRFDLEPEAIARAKDLRAVDDEVRRRILQTEDPGVAMLQEGLAMPSSDALSWRAQMGSRAPVDEIESSLAEARPRWSAISVLAMRRRQWDVAKVWVRQAVDAAMRPAEREEATTLIRYLVARNEPAGHIPSIVEHDLPPRSDDEFVGREEELQYLDDRLASRQEGACVVLHGMAGIGKTRLALEYAYRFQHEYERIIWVSGIGGDDDEIRATLEDARRVLVVIDDAEDESLLRGWSPRTGRVQLLFTVRRGESGQPSEGVEHLRLGPLSTQKGLGLLSQALDQSLENDTQSRDLMALAASLANVDVPGLLLRSALTLLWGEDVESGTFDQMQQRLAYLGLAEPQSDGESIRLHPLIWDAARRLVSSRHRDAVRRALAGVIRRYQDSSLAADVLRRLRPHVEHLWVEPAPGASEDELVLARGWSILLRDAGEYDRALELCERIGSWTEGASRAVFLLEASIALADQGRITEALAHARDARSIFDEHAVPAMLQAAIFRVIGRLSTRQRRFDDARSAHEQGLACVRIALAQVPDDGLLTRELSTALVELGDLSMYEGDSDEALERYEESLGLARQLVDRSSEGRLVRHELYVVLSKVGDAHLERGETDEALEAYSESCDLARELVRRDSHQELFLVDLSHALGNLGDTQLRRGVYATGEHEYEEGLEVARELVALTPSRYSRRHLASFLRRFGDAMLTVGRNEAALRAFSESVELARPLVEHGAAGVEAIHDLAVFLERVARASTQMGDDAAAVRVLQESLGLIRGLLATDPTHAEVQREWIRVSRRLGNAYERTGAYSEALDVYEERLDVARRRVDSETSTAEDRLLLLDALDDVLGLLVRTGHTGHTSGEAEELRTELASLRATLEQTDSV